MLIDIIDLNDEEFQNLSSVQLSMVRAAQAKKDELVKKGTEKKEKLFRKLLTQGVARSTMRSDYDASVDADLEKEVAVLREDLLYQLAYEAAYSDGNEFGPYRYPENPNYNLAAPQRFLAVRDYYMREIHDPRARLEAFTMDMLAKSYLGEYYQTLYDLFASYLSA